MKKNIFQTFEVIARRLKMGSIKGVKRGKYNKNRITPPEKVCCSYCGNEYKKRTSLIQHMRARHLKIKVTCPICLNKYTGRSMLNRHYKKKHGLIRTITSSSSSAPSSSQCTSSQVQCFYMIFEPPLQHFSYNLSTILK